MASPMVMKNVKVSLRPAVKASPVLPAVNKSSFLVWQPTNNKMFETFSYLPPLTDQQISKQVDYIVRNGWVPSLEFSEPQLAYVADTNTVRFGAVACGYQDNRYWTMWKLPLFGCTDPSQVLREVAACQRGFPNAYIRLVAFDNVKQVQIMGFLVQRPRNATDYCPVEKRSVGGSSF